MRRRAAALSLVLAVITGAPHASASEPDPWLGRDKALHFSASAALAAGTYAVSATQFRARWPPLVIGAGVAVGVGAGKELLDAAGLGSPSWKDFTWDVLGAITGLALAWGADLLIGGVSERHPALGEPRVGVSGVLVSF